MLDEELTGEIAGVLCDVLDRAPTRVEDGWRAAAQAGLLALVAPEAYGGEGLGLAGAAVLVSEGARRSSPLPFADVLVGGLVPLLDLAPARVLDAVVPGVLAGERAVVAAISEPAAPLTERPATRLDAEGLLRGRKVAVALGVGAPAVLLVTALSHDGASVVAVVASDADGVTAVPTATSLSTYLGTEAVAAEATYVLDGVRPLAVLTEAGAADLLRRHVVAGLVGQGAGLLAGALELTAGFIAERSQFGRRLAEFQAVAQQIADVYVASRAMTLVAAEAVRRLASGQPADDDLGVAALWLTDRLPAALQTCHHLHGGMGVDETYPLAHFTATGFDLSRRLGGTLTTLTMAPITETYGKNAELDDAQRAFKSQVRDYFGSLATRADREELLVDRHGDAYHRLIKQMGADGYLGVGWPTTYGGKGLDGLHQQAFANEAARADVHLPSVTLQTVGPTLQTFGTEAQKELFLPRILTGDVHFAIGYSEPDAGTDLASLRTTARRDPATGDWVINGQKMWTTGGHAADYIWLAARTDPEAPKHQGISIFIVDTRDPGFSWTPIRTVDGSHHVNATYFNDVRVPADMMVGEEGGGWRLITTQLNHERVMLGPAGRLEGLRDLVTAWAEPRGLLSVPEVRDVLARTTAAFRVNELLNWQVAARPATGAAAVADASACKVFASVEVQRLGLELMGIVSTYGDLADPDTAWLHRLLDATAKRNLVLTFGGGVNEVQRELIAQFGLGLPKVPR
ncbi:acyl-CoA dehydrogenase [Nocardioides sp.]|uniref:acyl-CoA dehydrogenase n=1 Tax=Nocardioides sp. TaxID=35761 RepID=UPI00262005D4|nr:acyl-CoA dehydrogenase [Nocardioides sp.]